MILPLLLALTTGDLTYVPKWHMTGQEACYGFDDAKTLITLDSKLVLCEQEETTYPKMIDTLKLSNTQLQTGLTAAQADALLWKNNATDLTSQLTTCTTEKDKAQADNSRVSYGWYVSAALVFVGTGLGLAYWLK